MSYSFPYTICRTKSWWLCVDFDEGLDVVLHDEGGVSYFGSKPPPDLLAEVLLQELECQENDRPTEAQANCFVKAVGDFVRDFYGS